VGICSGSKEGVNSLAEKKEREGGGKRPNFGKIRGKKKKKVLLMARGKRRSIRGETPQIHYRRRKGFTPISSREWKEFDNQKRGGELCLHYEKGGEQFFRGKRLPSTEKVKKMKFLHQKQRAHPDCQQR